jgi:hypothetical protein
MNSRERMRAALNHQQPDRAPLDLGSTAVTGIAASCYARLRPALGLQARPPKVSEPYQVLAKVEDDVRDALGVDTVPLGLLNTMFGFKAEGWKLWRLFDATEVFVPDKFVVTSAPNGDWLLFPKGDSSAPASARMPKGGFYFDTIVRQEPIDEAHLDPEEWVRDMYAVYTDEELSFLQKLATDLYGSTERSLMCNWGGGGFGDIANVPGPGVLHPKGIRDPLEWYVAHATHPEYIHGIFELQCEIALKNLELLWQAVGDKADAIFVSGTDLGSQQKSFLSPAMYRTLYKPFHKRVNDWIHAHTPWKIFYHTCGSIVDLLGDLAEVGVDILNPVQCSAKGMDPAMLKQKWGDKFVFWGAGVDTQRTLPFGTPEQVYDEVRERVRIFNAGGGFVFNTIHNIQYNVPTENLLAMFRALRDSA